MSETSVKRPWPEAPRCDFCNQPNPGHEHLAADFAIGESAESLDWASSGSWAACDACHELIVRGEPDALLERTVDEILRAEPGLDRELSAKAARGCQTGFWLVRTGEHRTIA